jgi:aminoglycoside 3-N-acetyltransferase I
MTCVMIRRLNDSNLFEMREVLKTLGNAFEDPESCTEDPPDDNYLLNQLREDRLIVLAALVEYQVVAGLIAHELPKLEKPVSEIYLYDLCVRKEWRRRGIARTLIKALQRIGGERGITGLYVQAETEEDDQPAIALYTKYNTPRHVLHFDLPIQKD